MSSLALMRWLENTPSRYDAGMRLITLGRADSVRAFLADAIPSGARVLEIGCGTGALTRRLVQRGARVDAFDSAPEMLELARERVDGASVTWHERTAAEIDTLPASAYDAVASAFAFSELSALERAHALRAARERLRPGGLLVIGDECRPGGAGARALHALSRVPQAILAWLLAGSTSRPLVDLEGEVRAAGLVPRHSARWLLGSLAALVAERPR